MTRNPAITCPAWNIVSDDVWDRACRSLDWRHTASVGCLRPCNSTPQASTIAVFHIDDSPLCVRLARLCFVARHLYAGELQPSSRNGNIQIMPTLSILNSARSLFVQEGPACRSTATSR